MLETQKWPFILQDFKQLAGSPHAGSHQSNNLCHEGMKRMPQLRFSIRCGLRDDLSNGGSGMPHFELACGTS